MVEFVKRVWWGRNEAIRQCLLGKARERVAGVKEKHHKITGGRLGIWELRRLKGSGFSFRFGGIC